MSSSTSGTSQATAAMEAASDSKANGVPKPPATEGTKEEKKLSGKELKALKAAEKQAKRAQQKGLAVAPSSVEASSSSSKPQQTKKDQKVAQGKQGQGKAGASGGAGAAQAQKDIPHRMRRPSTAAATTTTEKTAPKQKVVTKSHVPFFGHLLQNRRHGIAGSSKDVHPAVLALGLQMSRYEVCGSTARVLAMLLAFKAVVQSYTTPPQQHISRHFTPHVLSPQIDYLKQCRPISISMGNAIRYMKEAIASISQDEHKDEDEAKDFLCEWIDTFIKEKVQAADALIAESASGKVVDGDTILVYGKSSVVLRTLLLAKSKRKNFKVIVVDSKPLFEGKCMARDLATAGFTDIEYTLLSGISHCKATKTILGAHAMMTNGRLFSRVGTASVALAARKQDIPVMVLCESIKFADKAPLDSILVNELAQPLDLLPEGADAKPWEDSPNVQMLNLMYDVTPAEFVTAIYTEHGVLPPSSVPAMLRLLEDTSKQGL